MLQVYLRYASNILWKYTCSIFEVYLKFTLVTLSNYTLNLLHFSKGSAIKQSL